MQTDIIVIGSGIAGLSFALEAYPFGSITVITKSRPNESNTYYAQGGIAAVLDRKDSFMQHMHDTLSAGDGLCSRRAVSILARQAPVQIQRLLSFGVNFNKDTEGKIMLAREGFHASSRIVFTNDTTGRSVENVLLRKVRQNKRISILHHAAVVSIIVKDNVCHGCFVLHGGRLIKISAKVIVLATGGAGRLFSFTTNPSIATGDGIALAYNAGAKLQDLEFIQFHPTLFYGRMPFLISETVRGEGAVLITGKGRRFMHKYHRKKELASRDIVSRAILQEMHAGNKVFLDMRRLDSGYIRSRFPNIYKYCISCGLDITKKPIPVSPGAHYSCGGVKTDTYGRTSVKHLYAIGECACTGVHGADRLGSNSLMEGLVFGMRAAESVVKLIKKLKFKNVHNAPPAVLVSMQPGLKRRLQRVMWEHVGIMRTEHGLRRALDEIEKIGRKAGSFELRNMCTAAKLITQAALKRKESRGCHYLEEYPHKRREWRRHIIIRSSNS